MHLWGNTCLLLIILNDYSAASSLCVIAESPDCSVTSFAALKIKRKKKLSIQVSHSRQVNRYVCKYGPNFAGEEAAEPVKKLHIVTLLSVIHSKQF